MKQSLRLAVGCGVVLVLGAGGCSAGAPMSHPTATPSNEPVVAPEAPAPGDYELTLPWEGLTRTYKLHVPPTYAAHATLPLVVAVHYRGGDSASMQSLTAFDAKADREGFLVAYPNGIAHSMNALTCCGSHDDVGFVRSMVEHLVAIWRADPQRVYATGISVGAEMVFRLAVDAPGLFAAIAPVSGGFIGSKAENDTQYRSSRPVSVVSFVGNDDRSRGLFIHGLDTWQQRAGCRPGAAEWIDPDHSVYRFVAMCADGSEVISYTVLSMGHQWPGGTEVDGMGDPDTAIDAADVMWEFFVRHPRAS